MDEEVQEGMDTGKETESEEKADETQEDSKAGVTEPPVQQESGVSVEQKKEEKPETSGAPPEEALKKVESRFYKQSRGRPGQSRPNRTEGDFRGRRPYFRKKVCRLCVSKIKTVDYKDADLLKRFITERGKIMPRRMTGTCAKHQRILSAAIKRARMAALLPYVNK